MRDAGEGEAALLVSEPRFTNLKGAAVEVASFEGTVVGVTDVVELEKEGTPTYKCWYSSMSHPTRAASLTNRVVPGKAAVHAGKSMSRQQMYLLRTIVV